MRIKIVGSWITFMVMSLPVSAQRHYICYYAPEKPVIDGSGKDAIWQQASWTEDFTDIEGDMRPKPALRTRAKMLWDSANLYIYAELQETDLWGTLRQHDTIIYDDNDFEVFINPDNSTHRYFEIEINTLGTVMDLFMNKPYRNGGKALLSWDTQGLMSAVAVRGTVNHPGDTDSGWSVEMAIPLNTLRFWGDGPVRDGSQWRINFSRVEWDRDLRGGEYVVRVDTATGRRLPEHNWVWSPQGYINMHMPEKWGYLQFSARRGGADSAAFIEPADAGSREILWMIYEKEHQYIRQHGRYAEILHQLGLVGGKGIELQATDRQFMATVKGQDGDLSIDQDGEVQQRR